MTDKKVPKKFLKFFCENCDYLTCRRSQYARHILTAKHKILTNTYQKGSESSEIDSINNFSCGCGKLYKHRQSLFNHRKKCDGTEDLGENYEQDSSLITLISQLVKSHSSLQDSILEIYKSGTHNTNSHNINTITNSNNKTFNLNMFLNETCKDAMNITDFVDSIKFQLTDLENVGEYGYVKGISNIIVKNLNALDITQRPVHCADNKRDVLYVKDDNKWEREDSASEKIRKMIKRVALRNYKQVKEFKEKYPDCDKSESKYSDKYNKIIVESMGGSGDNDHEKEDKIIRNIAKEVVIDKEKYSI